jgi:hypothetical protein
MSEGVWMMRRPRLDSGVSPIAEAQPNWRVAGVTTAAARELTGKLHYD